MNTQVGEAAQTYIGSELELFAQALRWKSYVRERLAPHIRGDVLEVGAGIGSFTQTLAPLAPLSWCCLEPDPALAAEIGKRRDTGLIPPATRIVNGVLASLPDDEKFDTLIYLDVLEHIEDDEAEMRRAAARLRPGGKLIVLVPAFQSVYSAFDAAIGHYRRYTRKTLQAVRPASLARTASFYMDAPGLMLSLGNRLLLRSDHPRPAQIDIWDRFIVPLARILDPLVARSFGRSVIAIWQAPPSQTADGTMSATRSVTARPLPGRTPPRLALPRLALPFFALSVLGALTVLYLLARPLYRHLLSAAMRHPFRTPFFDLEYLLTTTSCWRQGIDVYVANPCDQLNRPMGYSPLWLRLGFLAIDRSWSAPLGLGLAVLFCLSLAVLPPTRGWRDQAVIGLAAVSSLSLFALERGNVDVMIYLASVCAACLLVRSVWLRLGGYILLLGAGLLKLYPFVALVSVARERLRLCIGLAAGAFAAIAVFVWSFHDELHRMAGNIPHGSVFSNLFGAMQLPAGLATALRPVITPIIGPGLAEPIVSSPVLALAGVIVPLVAAGWVVIGLVSSPEVRQAMPTLPARQSALFLIGSALIAGCFFTGQSIGYRGILLLLVIPGFLALDRPDTPPRLQRLARGMLWSILAVMFRLVPLGLIERAKLYPGNSALASLCWIGFEILWWWIAAVLLGLLGCLLIESPAAQEAWRLRTQRG